MSSSNTKYLAVVSATLVLGCAYLFFREPEVKDDAPSRQASTMQSEESPESSLQDAPVGQLPSATGNSAVPSESESTAALPSDTAPLPDEESLDQDENAPSAVENESVEVALIQPQRDPVETKKFLETHALTDFSSAFASASPSTKVLGSSVEQLNGEYTGKLEVTGKAPCPLQISINGSIQEPAVAGGDPVWNGTLVLFFKCDEGDHSRGESSPSLQDSIRVSTSKPYYLLFRDEGAAYQAFIGPDRSLIYGNIYQGKRDEARKLTGTFRVEK